MHGTLACSLVAFALLVPVGCGGSVDEPPDRGSTTSTRPSPPAGAIVVSAADYSFTPATIHLNVGVRMTLFVTNDSATDDHDMKSDLPLVDLVYTHADNDASEQIDNTKTSTFDVDFSAGGWAQVSFTPTTVGTYAFHCGQSDHADKGMVGTFVVTQ